MNLNWVIQKDTKYFGALFHNYMHFKQKIKKKNCVYCVAKML